jgi:phosphoribosylformimino-5-aminoimidazole carboxamide ribotide isomerase
MLIIPAVDLMEGKAVRLLQGDPQRKTVFSLDPVLVVKRWVGLGAARLHVVDLDGSLAGTPRNKELIRRLVEEAGVPVQLGGGIRDLQTAGAYLEAGVDRVILGTAAVENPELVQQACQLWPGRVAVAIDARQGRVTVRGWTLETQLDPLQLARTLEGIGVSAFIFTDVTRDGMQRGLNFEGVLELARSVSVPVIASGGVGSIEDIRRLARIAKQGIEGVIVGRALYEGALDLAEAIRVAQEAG